MNSKIKALFWGGTIAIAAVLSACGGGSGSAGTPILGAKNTNSYTLSVAPSGSAIPSSQNVVLTFTAKDAYGNGIQNMGVSFAFNVVPSTSGSYFSCLTASGQPNPGYSAVTDSAGVASVQIKPAPPLPSPTTIQAVAYVVPPGASAPTSFSTAAAYALGGIQSFAYSAP
jgi:hypothetical protein